MTNEERDHIKEILNALYRGIGQTGWSGEVNESVARVTYTMLCEIRKFSHAMNFVPLPTITPPTATWFVRNITRSFINNLSNGTYKVCQTTALYHYGTALREAQLFDTTPGLPQCQ